MTDARHHHYVPQGYLRGFAIGTGRQAKVYCIDLRERRSFWPKVRNVAGERDFNRVERAGVDPNILETVLGHFESDAATALRNIEAADTFQNRDDRTLVLNLIALIAARNPKFRSNISGFVERLAGGLVRAVLHSEERWNSLRKSMGIAQSRVSYAELRSFIDSNNYSIRAQQNFLIGLEQEGVDVILGLLVRRNWRLVRSDHGHFVTSDHPVCLINTIDRGSSLLSSPGYGTSETVVIFPLNKHQLLMGTLEPLSDYRKADFDQIPHFNSLVLSKARRQVYATNDTFLWAHTDGRIRQGRELLDVLCQHGR